MKDQQGVVVAGARRMIGIWAGPGLGGEEGSPPGPCEPELLALPLGELGRVP